MSKVLLILPSLMGWGILSLSAAAQAASARAASIGGIFVADQTLDKIYLTQDRNGNGNANDAGEISIYFDGSNASGLASPTGNVFTMLQAKNGFVYYGDGDTDSVYPASSPFEIAFLDDVAFISDTAGGNPRVYRAEDTDGDNSIAPLTEANIFIDGTNPFGMGVFYFGFDAGIASLYGLDLTSDSVFGLTDENNSGDIDSASEGLKVWDPSAIPSGFAAGPGAFSLATGPGGECMPPVSLPVSFRNDRELWSTPKAFLNLRHYWAFWG